MPSKPHSPAQPQPSKAFATKRLKKAQRRKSFVAPRNVAERSRSCGSKKPFQNSVHAHGAKPFGHSRPTNAEAVDCRAGSPKGCQPLRAVSMCPCTKGVYCQTNPSLGPSGSGAAAKLSQRHPADSGQPEIAEQVIAEASAAVLNLWGDKTRRCLITICGSGFVSASVKFVAIDEIRGKNCATLAAWRFKYASTNPHFSTTYSQGTEQAVNKL